MLLASLAFCFVVFLWQWSFFTRGGANEFWTNAGQHLYVLVWMLAVTIVGRTMPLRVLAAFWFVGLFPSMAVALTIGFPLADVLGNNTRFFDSLLVPILEESVKSGPILIFFWVLTRRGTWQPSITDGLLMGYVVGAAFGIHEDAMYRRVWGSGFDGSDLGLILPTITNVRLLGAGRLLGVYHAEWTALMGLAFGAAFLLRERFRWAPLLVLFALLVVVLDHGSANYLIAAGRDDFSNVLRTIDLQGWLPVWLLLAGIIAAVTAELLILRQVGRRDYLFKPMSLLASIASLRRDGVAGLRRFRAAREYTRARRAVHYALWAPRPGSADREQLVRLGAMLYALGERAGQTFPDPGADDADEAGRTVAGGPPTAAVEAPPANDA